MSNIFLAKSGIHINPKNKGKFTATMKRTGKSAEELSHSKNPLTRKRAIFALNARKWKHEDGGTIGGFLSPQTVLTPNEEYEFQQWYKNAAEKLKLNPDPDAWGQFYDMRGYWKDNKSSPLPKDGHFPDTYKWPMHPTFSDESKYAREWMHPGYWYGDDYVDPNNRNNYVEILPPSNEEMKYRQAHAESGYNTNAKNKRTGAIGLYQIMPRIGKAYEKATGDSGSLYDAEHNTNVRNWLMDEISNNKKVQVGNNTVRLAKQYASYNYGTGNLSKVLKKAIKKGYDIENSLDWLDLLPKETSDYVKFILLRENPTEHLSEKSFNDTLTNRGLILKWRH